jgi:hypothetical protein
MLLNPLKIDFLLKDIQNSVRTQETHYISATKTKRSMLFRKTTVVCCENHKEHTSTLCGQNPEFVLKQVVHKGIQRIQCV